MGVNGVCNRNSTSCFKLTPAKLEARRSGHNVAEHLLADLSSLLGLRLGPFSPRSDAVNAEEAWLRRRPSGLR